MRRIECVLLLGGVLVSTCFALSPVERREGLLALEGNGAGVVAAVVVGLDDENGVVRRTALRLLVRLGDEGREALVGALDNGDAVVRQGALRQVAARGAAALHLAKGLADVDAQVRKVAIEELVEIVPRTERVGELIAVAARDSVEAVRNIAVQALWPFYRQVVFKRDYFDLDLRPVATIKLPKDGWRFHLDPQRNGHLQDWYEPSFDDSGWDDISIEKVWQDAGYQYTGVTWYRRVVALPEKMDHLAVEMHFGGVDESAWVWVNGVYVGQHDIGPDGWNIPFVLDITDEVRWGMGNAVVVRAMNTRFAGGIWKPVRIEVLK